MPKYTSGTVSYESHIKELFPNSRAHSLSRGTRVEVVVQQYTLNLTETLGVSLERVAIDEVYGITVGFLPGILLLFTLTGVTVPNRNPMKSFYPCSLQVFPPYSWVDAQKV